MEELLDVRPPLDTCPPTIVVALSPDDDDNDIRLPSLWLEEDMEDRFSLSYHSDFPAATSLRETSLVVETPVSSPEDGNENAVLPFVWPDGRVEGGLNRPDFYKYPADLFGGLWEEGRRAIEEFQWWPEPTEEPPTASQVAVSQDESTRVTLKGKEVIVYTNDIVGLEEPPPKTSPIRNVEMQPRESEELLNTDTDSGVKNIEDPRLEKVQHQVLEQDHSVEAKSLPHHPLVDRMSNSPPWIPSPPKEVSNVHTVDLSMEKNVVLHSKETSQLAEDSETDENLSLVDLDVDNTIIKATPVGDTEAITPPECTKPPETTLTNHQLSPDAMGIDETDPVDAEALTVDNRSRNAPTGLHMLVTETERIVDTTKLSEDGFVNAQTSRLQETTVKRPTTQQLPMFKRLVPYSMSPESECPASTSEETTIPETSSMPIISATDKLPVQFKTIMWQKAPSIPNEQNLVDDTTSTVKTIGQSFRENQDVLSPPLQPSHPLVPQVHEQGFLESRRAPARVDSTRSPTSNAPMALENMPFGRTLTYRPTAVLMHPPHQAINGIETSSVVHTEETSIRDRPTDNLPDSSNRISSLHWERYMRESSKLANQENVAEAAPRSFLEGIEKAAAAASLSIDSGPTSLSTSTTPEPAKGDLASSPWAGSLLEQQLAQAPILDQNADFTPSGETVVPADSDGDSELSELSELASMLLLQHPPPIETAGANNPHNASNSESTDLVNTPIVPSKAQSQVPCLPASPPARVLATSYKPHNVPRKRVKPGITKRIVDKSEAALLYDQEGSAQSDNGGPRLKKQRTDTLTKFKDDTAASKLQAANSAEQMTHNVQKHNNFSGKEEESAEQMVSVVLFQLHIAKYFCQNCPALLYSHLDEISKTTDLEPTAVYNHSSKQRVFLYPIRANHVRNYTSASNIEALSKLTQPSIFQKDVKVLNTFGAKSHVKKAFRYVC
jgi:hypothetical protein